MRSAIVVFTKVPKTGEIKTRLTIERGGILTADEAKDFYEACLLDVIDACTASNSGDVWICYNQTGDRQYLDELLAGLSQPEAVKGIYSDQGGSFDDCIQHAADYILKNGSEDRLADSVLIIGGDLPGLQPEMIQAGIKKIETLAASSQGMAARKKVKGNCEPDIGAAIIEGACQEGGFSIVGYTCTTPFDFHGVFYNRDGITALDMLVKKAAQNDVPFDFLEMVPDVDIPVDLASLIPMLRAAKLAAQYNNNIMAAARTIKLLEEMGIESSAPAGQRDVL